MLVVSCLPDGGEAFEYEGAFRNNMFHGEGTLTDRVTNQTYVGSFVDNQPHGEGKLLNVYKPASAFRHLHAGVIDNAESVCVGVWERGVCISATATNVCIDSNGRWGQSLAGPSTSRDPLSTKESYLQMIANLSVTTLFPEVVLPIGQTNESQNLLGLYSGAIGKNGPEDASGRCLYADGSEFAGKSSL